MKNNIFDGLSTESPLMFYSSEYINRDHRFAIYNNNFRVSPGAAMGAEHSFVECRIANYNYKDTANIYLVNNIFQGNGTSAFLKCQDDFAVYSDYNLLHNFNTYMGGQGTIIGTDHTITDDPLFIDDELHVEAGSPAIDRGTGPTLFPGIPETDKEGVSRPQGSAYDIGAYEKLQE